VFLEVGGIVDTFALLELALHEIEDGIKDSLTAARLAQIVPLSASHLQRLFRLAFEKPLAGYVRSRKLAASLEDLLRTDLRIIDIAQEYGFEHERTYIRAFKREYGITPGEARVSGDIVKILPPLRLLEKNRMGDGLFFGPEFVVIPTTHIVGRRHKVPYAESLEMAPRVAKEFWLNDRESIESRKGDDVYIGLTRTPREMSDYSHYLPSVPVVGKGGDVPDGLYADTIPAGMYIKFHYVGQHHYFDLNMDVMNDMYEAIYDYSESGKIGGVIDAAGSIHFERIDEADAGDNICKLEWFAPVPEIISER